MPFVTLFLALALALAAPQIGHAQPSFVNFESGQVRPLALSPDGTRLFATNTPDNRLEIFSVDGDGITHVDSVPVGMEPVAVAARNDDEVWVVNHLSDSVSVVDVSASPPRVVRTLLVGDEPRDIVFAGTGGDRAFITTAHRGQQRTDPSISGVVGAGDPQFLTDGIGRADVWVFDATTLGTTVGGTPVQILTFFTDTPRALAVSADGNTVYVAGFNTGNQTTAISEGLVCNGFQGAGSCSGDGITSPGGLAGGMLPGGNPGPSANVENIDAPEVGLIVKYNPTSGHWEDELGRNWNNAVRFNLPDEDVFAVNANTLSQIAYHTGVGTTLFNMAVNPVSGTLYVSNTDSRNEVRFEGPGILGGHTVQGDLAEARITVIDSPDTTDVMGLNVTPRHLNSHIDYSKLANDPGFDPNTRLYSLATPLGMALDSLGTTLYVAAMGSSKIGVINVAALEGGTFDPMTASADYIDVSGGGPTGVVLDETYDRLYVLTRFDDSISVIDLGSSAEEAHVPVHDPEPLAIVTGRPFLYDAFDTSANGEASCASCHIFGDMDQLAWDLGNPDEVVTDNPNNIKLGIGAGLAVNGGADVDQFHPMKGPMTTQTLRGLANSGPMHWRGDRSNGFFGVGLNEALSFNNFIVAFEGLVGRATPISTPDMNAFTAFALTITLPPNPVRALDDSLTVAQQAGREFYLGARKSDGVDVPNFGFNCNGCHMLQPGQGFFGTDGEASFENELQIVKIPHLRNLYQKVGMFGMPAISFLNSGDNGFKGDQIRGYGFLHDGSIDTIFRFLQATVFNNTGNVGFDGPNGGNDKRHQMEQFLLAFDSDLAPIVGQQVTLDDTNASVAGPRIDLLMQRATTPFISKALGGNVVECDLIVKGTVGGEPRGWVMNGAGNFVSDKAGEPAPTDAALRAVAATPGQELTYTCVPPGSGQRAGIDRDEDGVLDGDDNCPAAVNPGQEDYDHDGLGNACDADPGFLESKDQQGCILALNKNMAKVAKAQGKDQYACIKDFAKGNLGGTLESCLTLDRKGKVMKAEGKTVSDANKKCTTAPDLGPTDAATVNAAAVQKDVDLAHDVFGPNLDASMITKASDKDAAACQQIVTKAFAKCEDTKLKEFNRCKKSGLKGETIWSAAGLEDCIGADPKGKIGKICDPTTGKLAGAIAKKCSGAGVDLASAFPGCAAGDPLALGQCIDAAVECRVCLAINAADGLARDCDEFDDGAVNGSCM